MSRKSAFWLVALALLVAWALTAWHDSWAAPGVNPHRQTVPTRTPTPEPETPKPTKKPPPPPETAQPTATLPATSEATQVTPAHDTTNTPLAASATASVDAAMTLTASATPTKEPEHTPVAATPPATDVPAEVTSPSPDETAVPAQTVSPGGGSGGVSPVFLAGVGLVLIGLVLLVARRRRAQ